MFETIVLILDSMLRLSAPLLFASLAGLFAERSGVFDIGLEGKTLSFGLFSSGLLLQLPGQRF